MIRTQCSVSLTSWLRRARPSFAYSPYGSPGTLFWGVSRALVVRPNVEPPVPRHGIHSARSMGGSGGPGTGRGGATGDLQTRDTRWSSILDPGRERVKASAVELTARGLTNLGEHPGRIDETSGSSMLTNLSPKTVSCPPNTHGKPQYSHHVVVSHGVLGVAPRYQGILYLV